MTAKKASRSLPAQIAIGSATVFLCLLVFSAGAAGLVLCGAIGQGSIQTAALCANTLAAFTGSLLAAKAFQRQKLIRTLACTGGYLLLLLLGNLLLIHEDPTGIVVVSACALGASTAAAMLASRKPKSKRRR